MTVQLDGEDIRRVESFYRTGGHWQLTDLPPGEYQLELHYGRYRDSQTVVLKPGERRQMVLAELEAVP